MIVKKVKYTDTDKPKVWQIGDLVDYIRYPHNTNAQEKVAHAGSRNFFAATHNGQKAEMIALAQESVHSKMPVSHWVFSWQEHEQPTRAQVDELVDIFLERMGLVGHQTVYGLHYNTENYHVHIAVNRTHPVTGKVVQPHKGFDKEEAHKILALVEHKQGWASEENSRYTMMENGELARNRRPKKVQPRQEAIVAEHATGEKSAQRIAQERGYDIINNATSWPELHKKLAEKGLRFEKKGSGAIVFVGEKAVKASSIDRDFGLSKLCKRLGEFVAEDNPPPLETMQPEPVSTVNLEEWQAYQAVHSAPASEPEKAEKQIFLDVMKSRHNAERKQILGGLGKRGLPALNGERHRLKMRQRDELRQFRQQSGRRQKPGKGKPRFETWLRGQGLYRHADRWRHRKRFEPAPPPSPQERNIMDTAVTSEQQQFQQYIAAVNADRVRVTCIRMKPDGDKKVFILDKKDGATQGFTPEEMETHMPEMLRLQQRGENIYYTPLSEARHHILIDDMTRESLEKLYGDGFRPAVVLESSPGNYQCVLTIPKLQSPHNRDVGNRITERLNRLYGDKKLSGCIHPHRAPGFGNLKPKHRREDGSFPKVRLLQAEKRECAKALELSRRIEREYAEAAKARKPQTQPPRPLCASVRPGDPIAAYQAHYENIRQHLALEDLSRVDAMIALRLRATGHSQQAVAEAVRQCGPTIREKSEGRNWQLYAERTAAYAFGAAGDAALAKNERYLEHWRKIEGQSKEEKQSDERVRMR
ncbi:relaxase/mobilization nuclease domain-containing protein [Desulfovibrio desulfuricans]|uniref:DNA-primase RepB domain-containing protein n=1 Tax=Desulfovibrio desulfuricans TaxID=876 RepID=UPI001786BCD1|nr:DNA-primase RepB domain-containing protein [Desulfovibrio desulfuricans]MBD8896189.1 relaxase/mobilization nuclease domain-containing protein [Desulfovibrio desulfuricans]